MNCKPLIFLAMLLLALASCKKDKKDCNGIQKKNFNNTQFDNLEIGSQLRLKVVQDDAFSIEIEGCTNDLNRVKVEQEGSTLSIWRSGNDAPADYIYVTIHMPELSSAEIRGAVIGEIGNFETEIPRIFEISGTSNIKFTGNAAETAINVSGAAVLKMSGNVSSYMANVSGTSQLLNEGFKSDHITVYLTGEAQAHVYAFTSIVGEVSGTSKLFYWGHPPQVEVTRNGQASIIEK